MNTKSFPFGLVKSSILLLVIAALFVSSCKKDGSDTDYLGGDWDLALTKVGTKTSLYPKLGTYNFPTFEAVITSNNQGVVSYKIKIDPDLTGHPDSAFLKLILDAVKDNRLISYDSEGLLDIGVQFKITSKGYQILSQNGKPQTIIRYDDPVGTAYEFDNVYSDTKVKGTITEKTGEDDWPFSFFYIKTTKVEFKYPESFPLVDKVIIRANHKFGLVYFEVVFKNSQSAKVDLIPWHML
jgi:hypothetical protein